MIKMQRENTLMTFNEKVWISILALCSLFWMSLVAAGVFAVIS